MRFAAMPQALRRSVTIGSGVSRLEVSPLCIGIVTDPDTVIAAWDSGVNFFFLTADMHWPLYEGLREGLRRLAKARPASLDEAVIACTAYVAQPEFQTAPFIEALSEIRPFQKLDILVAGGSYSADVDRRLAVLKANVGAKLVNARAVATSAHDRVAALSVINAGAADLAFVRYNAQHPGARLDLFPHLRPDRSTRIFNFKATSAYRDPSYFHGLGIDPELWMPSLTDYYRFVLCRPEVDGLLCAPQNIQQLEELIDAYHRGPLPSDEEDHLLGLAKAVLDASKTAEAPGA